VGIHGEEYYAFLVNLGTFFQHCTVSFMLYMTIECIIIKATGFGMILKEFMC
jgi:hypothetical protein